MAKSRGTDWHPADIKAALAKKGYTFARIARELGQFPTAPNQVLRQRLFRIEQTIARILEVPAQVIWPTRYTRDGQPRYRVRSIVKSADRHCQNFTA